MATKWYWAQIARHAGEHWIYLPDFIGVNVAAASIEAGLALAAEFAGDDIANLLARGLTVPAPTPADQLEPVADEVGRALVAVEVPGRSAKFSLSMDEALLKRLDQAAAETGETRSAFITTAVAERLRNLHPRQVTDEDVLRFLDTADLSKLDLGKLVRESLRKG